MGRRMSGALCFLGAMLLPMLLGAGADDPWSRCKESDDLCQSQAAAAKEKAEGLCADRYSVKNGVFDTAELSRCREKAGAALQAALADCRRQFAACGREAAKAETRRAAARKDSELDLRDKKLDKRDGELDRQDKQLDRRDLDLDRRDRELDVRDRQLDQ